MWAGSASVCEGRVPAGSIFAILHEEGHRLFPDELFADLFAASGRPSVPPHIVATVMVLQRLHGLSDREAVQAFEFDARWKWAAGGLDLDYGGFAHTVLVDMRARLARSARPRRVFEVTLGAAKDAGLVGHRRVLDSTPLYDAVATMDTVTLVRSAIRGLLNAADAVLEGELRAVLGRDDDYGRAGKPACDWDDTEAGKALVDELARDAYAALGVLHGREVDPEVTEAARLLAVVVGQDIEVGDDGLFRIIRGTAADRVISIVDPEARHGHKTAARHYDGYKGNAAADPDSEIITDTKVTPAHTPDAAAATDLINDLVDDEPDNTDDAPATDDTPAPDDAPAPDDSSVPALDGPGPEGPAPAGPEPAGTEPAGGPGSRLRPEVYGDSAYGTGLFLRMLLRLGMIANTKVQPPVNRNGQYAKDAFDVDTDAGTVTCPAGRTAPIRLDPNGTGDGTARFGTACSSCPFAAQCTTAKSGRTIRVSRDHDILTAARARQADPAWKADYRATRPKIERKLAHLMRRRHGGRRARMRGTTKIDADFNLLAAAVNLARLATLGLTNTPTGWQTG
jgi:hypothetical protein